MRKKLTKKNVAFLKCPVNSIPIVRYNQDTESDYDTCIQYTNNAHLTELRIKKDDICNEKHLSIHRFVVECQENGKSKEGIEVTIKENINTISFGYTDHHEDVNKEKEKNEPFYKKNLQQGAKPATFTCPKHQYANVYCDDCVKISSDTGGRVPYCVNDSRPAKTKEDPTIDKYKIVLEFISDCVNGNEIMHVYCESHGIPTSGSITYSLSIKIIGAIMFSQLLIWNW